jgi:hypothetical protein
MPELLSISGFIRRNKIGISNISNILKYAYNILNLQSYGNRLQNQIAEMEREKKLYIAPQNIQSPPFRPMPTYPV